MIKTVIKNDGTREPFAASKLNKWAEYATKYEGSWAAISTAVYRMLPEVVSSRDIHATMTRVCSDIGDLEHSRIAARLEIARLRKNMERYIGVSDRDTFKNIMDAYVEKGVWSGEHLPAYNPEWEEWYEECKSYKKEYWELLQWSDKYSLQMEDNPVETPHVALLASALVLHGDTIWAKEMYLRSVRGKLSLPTPALNGIRNGDFDSISCSLMESGDTTDSILVANHLAARMTAKKAGIGIFHHTRSAGDPVRNGAIDHLGKHGIFKHVEAAVKIFTQLCYSDDTEVMTDSGWKLFNELEEDDLVAQVHHDRTMTFVRPTDYVSFDLSANKDMYHFKNRYIDTFVTDNHRMIHRTKKYDNWDITSDGYVETRADEFKSSRCNVLDFGAKRVGKLCKLDAHDKFLIALQADGHVRVNKDGTRSYKFLFNKEEKYIEFERLMIEMGIPEKTEEKRSRRLGYRKSVRPNSNGTGHHYLITGLPNFEKSLTFVYDRDFNETWALEFLGYLSKWDAHKTKTSFEYYSEHMENLDAAQFVATSCGLYSSITNKGEREVHILRVCDFESVTTESMKTEIVRDYTGTVYCVTVPTGILIVRRNGRTLVCGNTRGGSATSNVLAIDPEIESIITWKSQRSAIDIRIDQIDYTMSYNDAFVDAVVKNEDWHLFSLYYAPEVHSAFYGTTEEFNTAVQKAVANGVPHKKIKARDLLKLFLTVRIETGRMYSFNATRVNTHTPYNETIHQSNLCVAPETEILTKNGYIQIHELEGSKVDVWNGEEWSEVDVVKTGVDQELMKVTTGAGHSLECTPYHKFYLFDGYGKPYKEVRAADLKVGDKLCKYNLPVISGTKELKNAYINGFYTGDGCLTPEGQRIYLYGEKIELKEEFGDKKWNDQPQYDRSYTHYDDLMDKYFVPMSEYSIASRVDWLAGFLDADGCVYRNGTNEQFTGSSNNFEFLQRTQRMLQTLGIDSKIVGARDAGYSKLPLNDGSGEYGEFFCKEIWRILIPSGESQKLLELGLSTKRLKMNQRVTQRDARHFIKITGVEKTGRIDDTYCFNEPKRHMGMFNGILTGQCLEIVQPTAPFRDMEDLVFGDENGDSEGEISFCGLSAANYSQIDVNDEEDIQLTVETGIRTVTRMIELAPMLYAPLRKKMLERMNVGFGITGLADAVYKAGLDYDGSSEFYAFVRDLAEKHTFFAYQASQKMFEEGGRHVPKGINLDWLPVDTAVNAIKRPFKMDWESLRGKPRAHSVLVSVQPSESSSVFSGGINAVYPARQARLGKQSRAGVVQQIFVNYDKDRHTSAWDVKSEHMSMMYSCVQDCIDQAISVDEFFDPKQYEGGKRPLSEYMKDFVRHNRLGNKTQYYINTKIDGSDSQLNTTSTDCEDCKM